MIVLFGQNSYRSVNGKTVQMNFPNKNTFLLNVDQNSVATE